MLAPLGEQRRYSHQPFGRSCFPSSVGSDSSEVCARTFTQCGVGFPCLASVVTLSRAAAMRTRLVLAATVRIARLLEGSAVVARFASLGAPAVAVLAVGATGPGVSHWEAASAGSESLGHCSSWKSGLWLLLPVCLRRWPACGALACRGSTPGRTFQGLDREFLAVGKAGWSRGLVGGSHWHGGTVRAAGL